MLAAAPAQARNLALLVGVGDYGHPIVGDLEGPPHDVDALRQVLIDHWGFGAADIRTLVDAAATRQAILDAVDALYTDSRSGDRVLFYYSGHGTSRHDPKLGLPVPHGSGALTAWDSSPKGTDAQVMGSLIVGRTDLKPRLQRLDQGGRHVFVVLDACYSANATRGLYRSLTGATAAALPTRQMPLRLPGPPGGLSLGGYGSGRVPPPPAYPYNNILTLAAASAYEPANDIGRADLRRFPTIDGRPHGAFTDALLRVLSRSLPADRNGDRLVSYLELRDAIARHLGTGGFLHRPRVQPKSTDDGAGLSGRPLFGAETGGAALAPVPDLGIQLTDTAAVLQESLRTLPGVSLVSERPDLIITRKDDAWFIVNAGGDKVGTAADDAALTARIRQLAWFHRLSWRKDTSNPFTLALEQTAAERGNINRLGERISFDIRPERDAWLVILYVDAEGVMAPLYPWQSAETAPLKGGERVRIPADDSLEVRDPLGTDLVIALGYSQRPAFLDSIVGATVLPPDSALYRDILASLRDEQTVAVATLELQTVPPAP